MARQVVESRPPLVRTMAGPGGLVGSMRAIVARWGGRVGPLVVDGNGRPSALGLVSPGEAIAFKDGDQNEGQRPEAECKRQPGVGSQRQEEGQDADDDQWNGPEEHPPSAEA